MAPLRARMSLPKDKFPTYFNTVKIQSYQETTVVRGAAPRSLNSIAWNPTGTLIATGSSDKTLRVWNPEKPNVRFSTELKGHSGPIEKVAFNPTKDAELCSLSSDGVARFWDARSKTCTNEIRDLGEANTLAWAPNGETLVVGNKAGTIFVLSPSQPSPLSSHQQPGRTNQIVFCWGGEKVFLATGDGRIRILSYPSLNPLLQHHDEEGGEAAEFSLKGHTSSCISIDVQPTSRYLASGGDDNVIALWDTTDWICQRTMTKVNGPVRSISFTWDGSFLVAGSDEGASLEFFHTESGERIHTIKTASANPLVAWAPTRYCLAYSDAGVLRIAGLDTTDRR